MNMERETLVEILTSVLGVGLFIVALLLIGATYNHSGLSSDGAVAVIGAIVMSILVMTGLGYWLSTRQP